MSNSVRETVRQVDARVPVFEARTQAADIDQTISQEIIFARLCTLFAILALVIACVGLYGTMSYNVARRTSEIGIRMALGAQRGAVVGSFVRQGMWLTVVGIAIGLVIAFATMRFMSALLYGVSAEDPITYITIACAVVIASLLACYLPSRRAAEVDPVLALRG